MRLSLNLCCHPDCQKLRRTRGLCYLHYNRARQKVVKGETTWEEQEREGKALPPNPEAQYRWSNSRGVLNYRGNKR